MPIMSKLTASYIAGFIDGEGYIGIIKNSKRNGRREDFYETVLKIANTNKDIIQWFKNSFGGSISYRVMDGNSKEAYCWEIRGEKVIIFLEKVAPYLKIKRKQSELIKKYRATINKDSYDYISRTSLNGGHLTSRTLKREVIEYREQLYKEIRKLNQRGKLCTLRD